MSGTEGGSSARRFAIGGTFAFVALAAAALWWDSATSVAGAPMIANRPTATPVSVATATQRDVPVYLTGLGTVQATNTIAIHTQVDGTLQSVNFVEGQSVHAGDVLAQIDPRLYQASLDEAKGKLAEDQAQLVSAQKDLERFRTLVSDSFETRQNLDHQIALVGQLQATIEADQASIEGEQTRVDYTAITSPIEALTGIRQVDPGNFVQTTDTTPIVTLTQIKPISVLFALPEGEIDRVRKAMQAGDVEVDAFDANDQVLLAKGKALLIDNVVDTTTGTITVKAIFPNDDEALWPGQFVNARLLLETQKGAVTIPTAAVQRGPAGLYAWTVASDGRAGMRPLQTGPDDGNFTVVTNGLGSGDRVVDRRPIEAAGRDRCYNLPRRRGSRRSSGSGCTVNVSEPFIRRPIATSLLMAAIAFAGIAAFPLLPVAPLPEVDFPTISVSAQLPGASPETMAAAVATPLERQFAQIQNVTELTSVSTLGQTSLTLQFDLSRNIDAAAQDVQAAITAAGRQLPTDLPSPPTYRKVNPADSPIIDSFRDL